MKFCLLLCGFILLLHFIEGQRVFFANRAVPRLTAETKQTSDQKRGNSRQVIPFLEPRRNWAPAERSSISPPQIGASQKHIKHRILPRRETVFPPRTRSPAPNANLKLRSSSGDPWATQSFVFREFPRQTRKQTRVLRRYPPRVGLRRRTVTPAPSHTTLFNPWPWFTTTTEGSQGNLKRSKENDLNPSVVGTNNFLGTASQNINAKKWIPWMTQPIATTTVATPRQAKLAPTAKERLTSVESQEVAEQPWRPFGPNVVMVPVANVPKTVGQQPSANPAPQLFRGHPVPPAQHHSTRGAQRPTNTWRPFGEAVPLKPVGVQRGAEARDETDTSFPPWARSQGSRRKVGSSIDRTAASSTFGPSVAEIRRMRMRIAEEARARQHALSSVKGVKGTSNSVTSPSTSSVASSMTFSATTTRAPFRSTSAQSTTSTTEKPATKRPKTKKATIPTPKPFTVPHEKSILQIVGLPWAKRRCKIPNAHYYYPRLCSPPKKKKKKKKTSSTTLPPSPPKPTLFPFNKPLRVQPWGNQPTTSATPVNFRTLKRLPQSNVDFWSSFIRKHNMLPPKVIPATPKPVKITTPKPVTQPVWTPHPLSDPVVAARYYRYLATRNLHPKLREFFRILDFVNGVRTLDDIWPDFCKRPGVYC